MIDKLIQFSIARRWLVMFLVLVTGALGVWNYQHLPIDAVPDITNVQVQINTEAPGYSPLEVEQRITYLVELAITGLPHVESTRSVSRYALSQVTVVFEKGTDIYFARNLINERLQQAKSEMPSGIGPVMGPVATGLGEIFHYAVHAKPGALQENGEPYDATALRTLQDWVIRPQLRLVPGVTEVNTIGGFEKQFHITRGNGFIDQYRTVINRFGNHALGQRLIDLQQLGRHILGNRPTITSQQHDGGTQYSLLTIASSGTCAQLFAESDLGHISHGNG